MTTTEMFTDFLSNLAINNSASITSKYEEITSALNKKFRNTESKTANSLQVGSYGRWTGIKGISDLDMLYIMPSSKWNDYKDGKQSKLLDDTKFAIQARYPEQLLKKIAWSYRLFTTDLWLKFNLFLSKTMVASSIPTHTMVDVGRSPSLVKKLKR